MSSLAQTLTNLAQVGASAWAQSQQREIDADLAAQQQVLAAQAAQASAAYNAQTMQTVAIAAAAAAVVIAFVVYRKKRKRS